MSNVMVNTVMQASTLHPQALSEGGRVSPPAVVGAGSPGGQVASVMRSLDTGGNLGWLPTGMGRNVDLMA
jgi:hypothetical protein